MSFYRKLHGLTLDQLEAQRATIETSWQITASGPPVKYTSGTCLTAEERCMRLFEASHPDVMRKVSETKQLHFTHIGEALGLTSAAVSAWRPCTGHRALCVASTGYPPGICIDRR